MRAAPDPEQFFVRFVVGWMIYFVVAAAIALVGMYLTRNNPAVQARFEQWRKDTQQRESMRMGGLGLAMSSLGLALGATVDVVAKLARSRTREPVPDSKPDDTTDEDASR